MFTIVGIFVPYGTFSGPEDGYISINLLLNTNHKVRAAMQLLIGTSAV